MAEPIRVLHVLGNTQLGGAESRTMDLYRHLDRDRVQFDFLVHTEKEGYFDQEIRRLGGRIFRIPRFRMYNYFSYQKAVRDFFREHHEFRAVQGHITSTAAIYLPLAKRAGIPLTIAHARSAGVDKGVKGVLTRLLRRNLSKKTDVMFCCSRIAGISVFGNRAVEEGRTVFIPNAIDCKAFDYDPLVRERIRKELGIEECYVIGHVGSFRYAKNHEYLLQVFAALLKGSKDDVREEGEQMNVPKKTTSSKTVAQDDARSYVLLLLGEGGEMERIRALAKELGIADQVFFLGNRGNVSDYYQAMDQFVYPSRFEGLPGAVVEAQTTGLPCLMSDSICEEVAVTDLIKTMSIEEDPSVWAAHIQAVRRKTERRQDDGRYQRRGRVEEMRKAGFDVNTQAERMMGFYEKGEWG